MSDLLFNIPESKSPRLLWLEKRGVTITDNGGKFKPGDECAETGAQLYRFCAAVMAFIPGGYGDHNTGWGDTEDEAITQLALKLGIKLWNEESSADFVIKWEESAK